ncbi:unnamed protein product, partial [Rotaria sp. Silwood2]
FIDICFVGVGIIRRSDLKFGNNDDDKSEKHLFDETIPTATALLLKALRNSIINSSKHSTSSARN